MKNPKKEQAMSKRKKATKKKEPEAISPNWGSSEVDPAEWAVASIGGSVDISTMPQSQFYRGWEAAKLDTFLILAERGEEFIVHPGVAKYLVPLVRDRLEDLKR